MNRRYTPEKITKLEENEIFVFGSNLAGMHGGGAARVAYNMFGAIWGQGTGLQGQSYAIPTMHGGTDKIRPYVDQFIDFASEHKEYTFLVTKIGCGIAGFAIEEMAPLFAKAAQLENVILPKEFVEYILHSKINSLDLPHWDSSGDFLKEYGPMSEKIKAGYVVYYGDIRQLRIKVFKNTIKTALHGSYITEENDHAIIKNTDKMMAGSRFYSDEFSVEDVPQTVGSTIVETINADCMEEGIRLLEMGYNPAVLNMANRQNPGGGVLNGAGAQEETIFRRTNLFQSLYRYAPYAATYGLEKSEQQYPMDRNYGGIYSPNVTVFRECEANGYKLMPQPKEMAFISVAGINSPELDNEGLIVPPLVEVTKNKIRTILRIGLRHGHDSLVLGALGCGAFCNPPKHVAKLFHEVMEEPEFKNKYKYIVFAILEDHNSHKEHNKEGNFMPFKEEFS